MIKPLKNYQYNIGASIVFTVTSISLNTMFSGGLALFLILSLGIIHGANDLKLLQQKKNTSVENRFVSHLIVYIGVVLMGVIVFYNIPHYGLLAFVLVSCYHFGEQHLESNFKFSSALPFGVHILYFLYGASIFSLLFYLQADSVLPIIAQISGIHLSQSIFQVLLILFLVCWSLGTLFYTPLRINFAEELFLLALIGVFFLCTDLLTAFALYFVFWHSVPSIQDQMRFLYGTSNFSFFKAYVYDSLVYWLAALFGLVFVYFFVPGNLTFFLPLFFSFLAAITFPHAVVMGKLQLGKRAEEGTEFNALASQENK